MTHSYVRGKFRNRAIAAPLLLAKTCHDLDLLVWFAARAPARVASFGSLAHFRPEGAPPGATARCTDGCPAQPECPHDAVEVLPRAGRAPRAPVAVDRRLARSFARGAPPRARDRPLRTLRLPLRQRRGRPPGPRGRVRGRPHRDLHRARLRVRRAPHDPHHRHARRAARRAPRRADRDHAARPGRDRARRDQGPAACSATSAATRASPPLHRRRGARGRTPRRGPRAASRSTATCSASPPSARGSAGPSSTSATFRAEVAAGPS